MPREAETVPKGRSRFANSPRPKDMPSLVCFLVALLPSAPPTRKHSAHLFCVSVPVYCSKKTPPSQSPKFPHLNKAKLNQFSPCHVDTLRVLHFARAKILRLYFLVIRYENNSSSKLRRGIYIKVGIFLFRDYLSRKNVPMRQKN